ncbi:iron-sulfur cluster assembly scaffold protein [Patescibacteria group bacterium]|nr:iron-sulfur cluster assembly scaffold protein [Patescibacteria group bacterium]
MNIYREELLDRYKNPQNMGEIVDATNKASLKNPLCGDALSVSFKTSKGVVTDIKFNGIGCLISTVSADMLADFVKGKTLREIKDMSEEQMLQLLEMDLTTSRKKCAILSLGVLKKALCPR